MKLNLNNNTEEPKKEVNADIQELRKKDINY